MPVRIKLFYKTLDGRLVKLPPDYCGGVEFPNIDDPNDMTEEMIVEVVSQHLDQYDNFQGVEFSIHWEIVSHIVH